MCHPYDKKKLYALNISSSIPFLYDATKNAKETSSAITAFPTEIPGTKFVVARKYRTRYQEVNFEREDKFFSWRPALNAQVTLDGHKGLAILNNVHRLVSVGNTGRILKVHTKRTFPSRKWIGIIGNEPPGHIFVLVRPRHSKLELFLGRHLTSDSWVRNPWLALLGLANHST